MNLIPLALILSLVATALEAEPVEPPGMLSSESLVLFEDLVIDPRLNPAISDLFEGRPEPARRTVVQALAEIQREEGIYSRKLILPYVLQAEAEEAAGRLDEADESLTRAQHLTHRAWGSNSLRQLPIVQRRADLNIARGEYWEGEQLSAMAVRISREQAGVVSVEFVDAAVQHGRRVRLLGEYKTALSGLRRAIKDVEAESSPLEPLLVPLLRERARSFLGGPLAGRSLWMTRRALEIMDANPDTFSAAERVAAHVEYGDLQMMFSYERAAVAEYEQAWALADAAGESLLRETLERPAIVRYRTFIPQERATLIQEQLDFELDITDDGRPRNIEVVSSTAEPIVNYYAPRIIFSEVRYRPAISNGVAQAVSGHRQPLVLGLQAQGAPRVRELFQPREPVGMSAGVSF